MSDAGILAAIDRLPRRQLVVLLGHIANRLALDEPNGEPQDEFLSVKELAARTPLAEGTIRNLISAGSLVEGTHYAKRGGRVIFSWHAVRSWLMSQRPAEAAVEIEPYVRQARRRSA